MMGQNSGASNLEMASSWNFLAGNVGPSKFSVAHACISTAMRNIVKVH